MIRPINAELNLFGIDKTIRRSSDESEALTMRKINASSEDDIDELDDDNDSNDCSPTKSNSKKKHRRNRTTFTTFQLHELERAFEKSRKSLSIVLL